MRGTPLAEDEYALLLRIPMWVYEACCSVCPFKKGGCYESPCGFMRDWFQFQHEGGTLVTNPHVGL